MSSIRIQLLDPTGQAVPVETVTVTESVNAGWTWSAVLGQAVDLDAWLEDDLWSLELEVDGDVLTLPPLVALDMDEDLGSGGGSLSGVDLVTYRLTRSNHVLWDNVSGTPYRNTTTTHIIDDIAANIAMAGSITGHTVFEFPILEGGSLEPTNYLDVINRIADAAGYEWRAVAGGATGVLEFYPLEFAPAGSSPALQPAWTNVRRRRSRGTRITRVTFVKTSKIQTGEEFTATAAGDTFALATNLHSAQVTAPGATLWAGDPLAGGTQLGTGVSFAAGTVTHVQADAPGKLTVMGTPVTAIPAGVELAFKHEHDSGLNPARPADEAVQETLWPNLLHVQNRAQLFTWRLNRQTHMYDYEGPPALWLGLGYRLSWPGRPDARAESITHTLGRSEASTSAVGAVLGSAQW